MYFQNVFNQEFVGALLLSDRQFNMMFKIKGNTNSSRTMMAWNNEPYDVSTNKNLTFNYSFDYGKIYAAFTVDVSTHAAVTSAATCFEIAAALNANSTFAALYNATVTQDKVGANYLLVNANRPNERWKTYISNGGAEIVLRFNKKAGVGEMPSYFVRHTIANQSMFPDGMGALIQLDPTTTQDQQIIIEAGFSHTVGVTNTSPTATTKDTSPFVVGESVVVTNGTTTLSTTIIAITPNVSLTLGANWTGATGSANIIIVHADWQLLHGRSGIFNFQKITVDGSDRITEIIEYAAGAVVGDLARRIDYTYTGTNTNPSQITETPYVLTSSDLVTPP